MPLIPGVGAFQRKTQQLLLKALTHSGEPDQEIGERVMQYFPSSLQYGEPVNWSSEVPPGGTAPIHQWMSNGPDTLPLEIWLSRDTADLVVGGDEDNVDIDDAMDWLRSLKDPSYEPGGRIKPPPVVRVVRRMHGTTSNRRTIEADYVVVGFDGEVRAFFPDGTPRLATVSLSLEKHIGAGRQKFTGREDPVRRQAARRFRVRETGVARNQDRVTRKG